MDNIFKWISAWSDLVRRVSVWLGVLSVWHGMDIMNRPDQNNCPLCKQRYVMHDPQWPIGWTLGECWYCLGKLKNGFAPKDNYNAPAMFNIVVGKA
jgi:hypothetical protein